MEIIATGRGMLAAFDLDELMGLQGAALTLRASVAEFGWPTASAAEGFFESEVFLQVLEDTLHAAVQQITAPDQESQTAAPERGEIMSRQERRGSGVDAALTNEDIHTAVLALCRSLAHEVRHLMTHRHPTLGIYTRLRDQADALYSMVDWVHNAGRFGPEEEAEEAEASS